MEACKKMSKNITSAGTLLLLSRLTLEPVNPPCPYSTGFGGVAVVMPAAPLFLWNTANNKKAGTCAPAF